MIMPLSTRSAARPGGVLSNTDFTASMIAARGSVRASFSSVLSISIVVGMPVTRFLPLISITLFSSSGSDNPRLIFIVSADSTPI